MVMKPHLSKGEQPEDEYQQTILSKQDMASIMETAKAMAIVQRTEQARANIEHRAWDLFARSFSEWPSHKSLTIEQRAEDCFRIAREFGAFAIKQE